MLEPKPYVPLDYKKLKEQVTNERTVAEIVAEYINPAMPLTRYALDGLFTKLLELGKISSFYPTRLEINETVIEYDPKSRNIIYYGNAYSSVSTPCYKPNLIFYKISFGEDGCYTFYKVFSDSLYSDINKMSERFMGRNVYDLKDKFLGEVCHIKEVAKDVYEKSTSILDDYFYAYQDIFIKGAKMKI